MICRNCNKEISDTSAFCPNCGMLFVVSTPESSPEIRRNNNLPFYSAELFRKMVQEENAQREAEKPAEVQGDAVPAEDSADAQLDKMYARALQLEREERTAKMRMEAEEKARIADEIARKEAEEELKKRMAENERHDREVAEELAKKNVIDEEALAEEDIKEDSAEERTEDEIFEGVENNENGEPEVAETVEDSIESEAAETVEDSIESEAAETVEDNIESETPETGEDDTEAEGESEDASGDAFEKSGASEAEEGDGETPYPEDDSDDYIFGDEEVEEPAVEEPVVSADEESAEVVEEEPAEVKPETEEKSDGADIEETEESDTSETEETEESEAVESETEAEESEAVESGTEAEESDAVEPETETEESETVESENKAEESEADESETKTEESGAVETETEETETEETGADESETNTEESESVVSEEVKEDTEISEESGMTEENKTEEPQENEAETSESETAETEPVKILVSVAAEKAEAENSEAEGLVEIEAIEEIESAAVKHTEEIIDITDTVEAAAELKPIPEIVHVSIAAEEGSEKAEESEAENKDKTEILSEQLKQKKYQKKQKRSKSKKKNRKAKREGKDSDQLTEKQGAVSELKTEEKSNVPEPERDSVTAAEREQKTEKPVKVVSESKKTASESKKTLTGPKINSKAGLTVGAAAAVVVLSLISLFAWNNKPENRAARILKDAESAYSSGDFEVAEGLYSQYMELGDAETETLLHMADTYVNRNRHDEAVDMIKAALDAHPESEALQKAYNDLNPVISFSEAGGTFDSPISIGLSSSGNCDIYYTLKTADGAEELSKYYLPIILEENGTYEVEAYGQTADGYKGSSVIETYVIDIAPEEEETEESVEETVEETDNGEFSFAKEYESYPDTLVEIQTKDRKDMGDYSVFEAQVYHDHEKDVPVGESRTETIKISNKAWLHYKDYNPNEVRAIDAYVFLKYIGILNARTDENGIVTDFDFYLGRQR
ncbi:MAG: zinc-ribbon domain-containing protein [Oribacterium sp.]|nr:zinc-ribbon domain-containing protein [Oribacterium sp.]